jgi:hypothetical protein
MLIIWRRWGWLVLPLFLLVWTLATGPVLTAYGSSLGLIGYFNPDKAVAGGLSFLIVAPLIVIVDVLFTWLSKKVFEAPAGKPQLMIPAGASLDSTPVPVPAATQAVKPKRASFFFIPMWIWGLIFAAIGVIMLVINVPISLEIAPTHHL